MKIPAKKINVNPDNDLIALKILSVNSVASQIVIDLNLPIDNQKYIEGNNLIDSLESGILPDFRSEVAAIDIA